MAGTASQKKPVLPEELVSRWPPPEQLPRFQNWGSMTCDERERWLIEGAYEQTDDGWVVRADRAGDETAQQVVQAVTTVSGADTIAVDLFQEVVKPALDDAAQDGPFDSHTGRPEGDEQLEGHIWAWYAVVAVLLLVIVVAALLTDMFGTRGGSDPEPSVADQVVDDQSDADEITEGADPPPVADEPAVDEQAVADGPVVDEQAVEPDPATITFSSLPEHVAYAKTWSDGEIGITLNADGTYRFVSSGVDNVGEFKMTAEDGVDRLLFLDPDDPSGLYVTSQLPVSIDDGVLVYGQGEGARRLSEVPELPEIAAVFPAPQFLDFAASEIDGSWLTEHSGLGLNYRIIATSANGGLDIDIEAGTISGTAEFSFVCEERRCLEDGDDVSGTARFTVTTGTLSGSPGRWRYEGTASIEENWQAATGCDAGTCGWPYSTTFDTDYRISLSDEFGEGYFKVEQVEGSSGDDIAYSIRLSAATPFVGS